MCQNIMPKSRKLVGAARSVLVVDLLSGRRHFFAKIRHLEKGGGSELNYEILGGEEKLPSDIHSPVSRNKNAGEGH